MEGPLESSLFITVTGAEGAGKGTVLPRLAQALECELVDMGDVLRQVARDHGMELEALHRIMKTEAIWDQRLDDRVRALPSEHQRLILCSRTAWFLHPHSIKVFLTCSEEVGAQRVAQRLGKTPQEALEMNRGRIAVDADRYRRYLGITDYPPKPEQFDIVIDTSHRSPDQVLSVLIRMLKV